MDQKQKNEPVTTGSVEQSNMTPETEPQTTIGDSIKSTEKSQAATTHSHVAGRSGGSGTRSGRDLTEDPKDAVESSDRPASNAGDKVAGRSGSTGR